MPAPAAIFAGTERPRERRSPGEYEIWKGIAPAARTWWLQVLLMIGYTIAGLWVLAQQLNA